MVKILKKSKTEQKKQTNGPERDSPCWVAKRMLNSGIAEVRMLELNEVEVIEYR